jgi:flavin-dependent dehydrogenase
MHDLIVVGAGVAGSYLASKLGNLDVLVLEKSKEAKKDSGIVSKRILEFFPEKPLRKEIREMKFFSPSGLSFSLRSEEPFAYFLKRDFTSSLRKKARKNSEIRYETVNSIEYLKNSVIVHTDSNDYECRLVIGADGANSVIRKAAGIRNPKIFLGMMTRTRTSNEIKIYTNKYFSPDFFTWIIPGEYGLITAIRPKDYFEYFRKTMNLPEGQLYSSPISIGYTRSYSNRVLLVGDSCGMTKPLTGGGIIFSLIACNYAAQTVKEAFRADRFDSAFLKHYEKKWKSDFGCEIRKQLLFRKVYRKLTNKDIDNLFKDFGPAIDSLKEFDYDHFSKSWKAMPKLKLLRFLISNLF